MFNTKYLIMPPLVVTEKHNKYILDCQSYSDYNYLRPGISSYIKTRHLEASLKLTKDYFHKTGVIDFGCADGILLPSLSRYFTHVAGIERDAGFCDISIQLCKNLGLGNVGITSNAGLTIGDIKSRIGDNKYGILYLLEVLEHIGEQERLYESKVDFLNELFTLLEDNGLIVISVPRMIGMSFLVQRIGMLFTGIYPEPISFKNMIRASFFSDTSELEKTWMGGYYDEHGMWIGRHLGFNEQKMQKYLEEAFTVVKKKKLPFTMMYVIKKK